MDNKEIYRKTITFSIHRMLWDVLAFLGAAAVAILGYYIAEKAADQGVVGLIAGALIGLIALVFVLRFITYTYKAGQIAMMTRAVTQGSLPEDVLAEGKRTVKERFLTVAAFFAATGVIKGIFNQIGKGITALGESIGGDSGSAAGSAISAVIQTVVSYLCDCCLGWVFYRSEEKATRATCEGAVLFFRHGKTLARNMGRVFGMGLVSLVLIGGVFFGIFCLVLSPFGSFFQMLSAEFAQIEFSADANAAVVAALTDPRSLMLICAALGGIILWRILHAAFVRPFVLVGVLRNYIESGMKEIPSEASFAVLDSKSAKFRKLHTGLA